MPNLPYTISGICYDVNSTDVTPVVMTSGTCMIFNTTTHTTTTGNIEIDGSFAVDISALASYSNADKLQVVLFNSDKTKSTEFRHTVDTAEEGDDVGSVYMHWTKPILGEARLHAVVISNKNDSNEYTVDFYDRYNDAKILSCDVNVNSSFSPNLSFQGLMFKGGICVIRQSDVANEVDVVMVVK